ncbi:hypothetical protein BpHYR1_032198 [Brachionus plicatilis]|uniref:Uncharacterized protein n=1 Tax=Brachionus plicatilis TaxID=10195 RepID=A0A3M7RJG0_BRAPC|nr:hypothetical protein BpHYR1_032198 [Brachionus plicatilis]
MLDIFTGKVMIGEYQETFSEAKKEEEDQEKSEQIAPKMTSKESESKKGMESESRKHLGEGLPSTNNKKTVTHSHKLSNTKNFEIFILSNLKSLQNQVRELLNYLNPWSIGIVFQEFVI